MTAQEILRIQRLGQFRGLRIYLSDGAVYEIKHPELMLVSRLAVTIALDLGSDGVPDRVVSCDPIHITRVEPMHGEVREPVTD
jgi:hypothetical protein